MIALRTAASVTAADNRHHPARYALAIAIPVGIAAATAPFRSRLPNTTVALLLALSVTGLAAIGPRAVGACAGLSAGLGFDLLHTRPYGSLAIAGTVDVQTTVLLVVLGLAVGQIAARSRRHRSRVVDTVSDLVRVHGVAEMVAAGEPVEQVILAAAEAIAEVLGLCSCVFDASFPAIPGPFVERHGAVTWGRLAWNHATLGLPSGPVSLVLEHQGRPVGRFVLTGSPGQRVSDWQLLAAIALADQAGCAIAAQGRPAGWMS